MERGAAPTEIWRALYGAAALHRAAGKYVVAVNDDIDPDNADAILWALSYRANPARKTKTPRPGAGGPGPRANGKGGRAPPVLLAAPLKENSPPVSLPK